MVFSCLEVNLKMWKQAPALSAGLQEASLWAKASPTPGESKVALPTKPRRDFRSRPPVVPVCKRVSASALGQPSVTVCLSEPSSPGFLNGQQYFPTFSGLTSSIPS